jgi:NADPH:quinone reductase-like Zn-dependent oxidoreductase
LTATSVNPFDVKQRSGQYKGFAPLVFPAILGADVAGIVTQVGPEVSGFSVGDRVFAQGRATYAQLCAVAASHVVNAAGKVLLVV